MKPSAGEDAAGHPVYRGLRFRVAALLALSLLPLGLVTYLQTQELATEARSRSDMTLLSLTGRATHGERQSVERALGAVDVLSVMVEFLRDDPDACRATLRGILETSDRFSFIGLIEPDGVIRCSTTDRQLDHAETIRLVAQPETPPIILSRLDTPEVSGEPVINLTRAVTFDDGARGLLSVSIPVRHAEDRDDLPSARRPDAVVTFNTDGAIVTIDAEAEPLLPRDIPLIDLVDATPRSFDAVDRAGEARTFTMTPIIPNVLYALAAWPPEKRSATVAGRSLPAWLLPLLMFAASIGVAYLAVDRLVVRHIRSLRRMMQAFAQRRALPSRRHREALSTELAELEEGFVEMALDLSNDEARMEDALREKNVLLKEIHHRVKNNLQLISSIMNMQIRAARHDETVGVLRRLQERVMGLATVHRNLYQTDDLSRTDAGLLLRELFEQLLTMAGGETRAGLDYEGRFEEVILFPDQALPLSLLASELGTNAIKHMRCEDGDAKVLKVALRMVEDGMAELTCENTVPRDHEVRERAGGLGARLIKAFAAQLGGKLEQSTENGRHKVRLRFQVETFTQTPADY
ncbi:sensor histidine kinase [Jannaschia seohaensis]|uniref:histidine kinase n=1 Tax=Jannaschia seohaensis TaxID=475081 RepID=A0A2Y9BW23_9RHOB|nr:histidine kinase dimerization/phosphoacceptor domain -containing protein [Jannaschia seohaensis]PWJ22054.1 two-component sensor histidine kinase [Jannaschia seohaensis]SSA38332.1 Two-component sensor histidine kinase, contains HisKA and HATPase domains [Jannaschia seohaensis]